MKEVIERDTSAQDAPASVARPAWPIGVNRIVHWLPIGVAVLIVGLTLVPVATWRHPSTDAVYNGFDPNLMFVSAQGPGTKAGAVDMSSATLTMGASDGAHPTADLVTTPLSFSASFDATVVAAPAHSVPIRIGLWSPETAAGYFMRFDPDLGNAVMAETVSNGGVHQDLVGGTESNRSVLAQYAIGRPYRISVVVDQSSRSVTFRIEGSGIASASARIGPKEAPDLFKAFRYALTLAAWTESEPTSAKFENLALSLPPQTLSTAESAVRIDDQRARIFVLILWVAAMLLGGLLVVRRLAALRWSAARRPAWPRLGVSALVAAGVLYLAANLPLFGLASPHYDVFSAKVWAFVASHGGLVDLYYRTLLVPTSAVWSGVPLHEAGFPYGMTKAYYYAAIGWIFGLWPAASPVPVNSFSLEVLLKSVNVVFGFVDGVLVYLIAKRLVPTTSARISALLMILNPAVIFVMSVWGSTETVSLFFVLSSILLAEARKPTAAWLLLAGAAYTRPQMIVFAFLLGLVYVRRFGLRANLSAVSWAIVVSFIFIGPFALTISPSLPVDYFLRTFVYHFGNGQADVPYLGTSPGYYSIWTLPLLWVSGHHGLDRMWSPTTQHLVGSLTYGQIGTALSIGFLLVVGAVIVTFKRPASQPGGYLPIVAFGMLGWLVFTPGLISRYFVYAIVAVILCRKAFDALEYVGAVTLLTVITLVCSYGHIGLDFLGYSGGAGLMSPTNNAVSHFVFTLFSSDWFITVGAAVNAGILVLLGGKVLETLVDRPIQGRPEPALA